jgi:hypothetical protein
VLAWRSEEKALKRVRGTRPADVDAVYGPSDSADLAYDLAGLFVELEVARDHATGVLVTIDELHYVSSATLEVLVMGLDRTSQLRLPITIAAAGLPNLASPAGEAKSYAGFLYLPNRSAHAEAPIGAAQISRQGLQFCLLRQRWSLGLLCLQGGLGLGDGGELGFPALLEAASYEPVLRFAEVEGALSTGCLVTSTFHLQLERPQGPGLALVKLLGGGHSQGDLFGDDRLQQPPLDYRASSSTADMVPLNPSKARAVLRNPAYAGTYVAWPSACRRRGGLQRVEESCALVVKAVEAVTTTPWVLLYVKRWLAAPLQFPDGTIKERDKGTPQGSLCSAAHNPPYEQYRVMRSVGLSGLVRTGSAAVRYA